jgi:hypothetical protein
LGKPSRKRVAQAARVKRAKPSREGKAVASHRIDPTEEYIKNLEENKTKIWIAKKIWISWPANRSRSGTKKQKRGLVNDLDLLKKEL